MAAVWLKLYYIGMILLPHTQSYCHTVFANQNYLVYTCKSKCQVLSTYILDSNLIFIY